MFADLALAMKKDTNGVLTDATTLTLPSKLTPGDTITIDTIKVSNTGEADCYALLNFQITITPTSNLTPTISYSTWYNLSGQLVHTYDLEENITQATQIQTGNTANLTLNYVLSGADITNEYMGATASFTLSSNSVQSVIPAATNYVDPTNYATWLIVKSIDNASATFTSRQVPETYFIVNYLQSAGMQYINSGIDANDSISINARFNITRLDSTRNYVVGVRGSSETRIQFSYSRETVYCWGGGECIKTKLRTFPMCCRVYQIFPTTRSSPRLKSSTICSICFRRNCFPTRRRHFPGPRRCRCPTRSS